MNHQAKKDTILKWLSLSGYYKSQQTFEFISQKLRIKYPILNYSNWDKDLADILIELEENDKLILREGHTIFRFYTNPIGKHDRLIEKHYLTNFDGDAYVQKLPKNHNEINNDATIELLDLVLCYLPFYGVFGYYSLIVDLLPDSADERIFIAHFESPNCFDDVFNFLVRNGYAIERGDIKMEALNIELTERGRWLKQQGSMQLYRQYQDRKRDKKEADEQDRYREVRRNEYAFWVTVSIAISTGFAAAYYLFELQMVVRKNHLEFYKRIFPLLVTLELSFLPVCIITCIYYIMKSNSKRVNKIGS